MFTFNYSTTVFLWIFLNLLPHLTKYLERLLEGRSLLGAPLHRLHNPLAERPRVQAVGGEESLRQHRQTERLGASTTDRSSQHLSTPLGVLLA